MRNDDYLCVQCCVREDFLLQKGLFVWPEQRPFRWTFQVGKSDQTVHHRSPYCRVNYCHSFEISVLDLIHTARRQGKICLCRWEWVSHTLDSKHTDATSTLTQTSHKSGSRLDDQHPSRRSSRQGPYQNGRQHYSWEWFWLRLQLHPGCVLHV